MKFKIITFLALAFVFIGSVQAGYVFQKEYKGLEPVAPQASAITVPEHCAVDTAGEVWCLSRVSGQPGYEMCGYESAAAAGSYYTLTDAGAEALGLTITTSGDCATNYTVSDTDNAGRRDDSNICWTAEQSWDRSTTTTATNYFPIVRCVNYE